ncbi:MAG: sigma-70 family RNA polymerase sigma factor [Planctomycetaceae bacterium]|nr:sigma-70 family RNA polymerase sigma factor [Planctomycetaceae bacterium]
MDPSEAWADPQALLERSAWARRLATGLVNDAALADDLAQDAQLAALGHRFEDEPSLRNWMVTVLRRLAARSRRSDAHRRVREERSARPERVDGPDAIVARAQQHERLVRLVLELGEPYRSTVLLRYFDELSPARIADLQKLPLATVKTRLSRALQLLRERLDHDCSGKRAEWLSAFAPLVAPPAFVSLPAWFGVTLVKLKFTVAAVVLVLLGLCVWRWQATPDLETLASATSSERVQRPRDKEVPPAGAHAESARVSPTAEPEAVPASEARDLERVLGGRVTNRAGVGIPGASVSVWPRASSEIGGDREPAEQTQVARLTTDGEGRFEVKLQRGHGYELHAAAKGYSPAAQSQCAPGVPLEIVLPQQASLSGQLRFPDGAPVRRARLELTPFLYFGDLNHHWLASSDESGRYELLPAPVGGWRVTVKPLDGLPLSGVVTIVEGSATVLDLVIERGGRAEGVVRDGRTLRPIEGAWVTDDEFGERAVRTDAEGRFALPGFEPGSARWSSLYARASGYADGVVPDVRLDAGVAHVEFLLEKGRTARGSVVDANGTPLADARVEVQARGVDIVQRSVRTGRDGHFELPPLRLELDATLRISKPGFGTRLYDLPPADATGERFQLDPFRLEPATLLVGRVVDEHGRALEGWSVQAAGCNADRTRDGGLEFGHWGRPWVSALTRGDGSFTLGDLCAGSWTVSVTRKGFAGANLELPLELADGERRELGELVLRADGTIAGRVLDEHGVPLFAATVEVCALNDPNSRLTYTFTDAAGRFVLDGLPDVPLTLAVGPQLAAQTAAPQLAVQRFRGVKSGERDVTLRLRPSGLLRGRLVLEDGSPCQNAWVGIFEDDEPLDGFGVGGSRTDERGEFEFRLPVDVGYTLRAVKSDGDSRYLGTWTGLNVGAAALQLVVRRSN